LTVIERDKGWKFRQLLRWSSRVRLRPGTTSVDMPGCGARRNGDDVDVYSLSDRAFDQSRVSTRTSSRWDWLDYRQTTTAGLGRPFKVSWRKQFML